jgi:hypothetical protein
MRVVAVWTVAAALVAALPSSAYAQNPASAQAGATPEQSPRIPPQTPTATGTTSTTSSASTSDPSGSGSGWWSSTQSHWTAAGFVGGNFGGSNFGGTTSMDSSVDFGGQVGYLYRGIVGGEFLADFTPQFQMNNALFADNPNLNTYMANLILAVPMGAEHRVQPYVSGGFGSMQLRSNVFASVTAPSSGQSTANAMIGGGDLGFGVLGYAGNVGIRGDVRYFRAFTDNSLINGDSAADAFARSALSGLDFWRANIGVAVRW